MSANYLHIFCERQAWCDLAWNHHGPCMPLIDKVPYPVNTVTTTGSNGEGITWVFDKGTFREATPEECAEILPALDDSHLTFWQRVKRFFDVASDA